jgi:hypothetical protein
MRRSISRRAVAFVGLLLASAWPGTPARAGFVNGVERFDGKTLDTETWRARNGFGTVTFAQDDALTIDSSGPGDFNISDAVTRFQTVPIGGSARTDVVVHAARRDQEFNSQTAVFALTSGFPSGAVVDNTLSDRHSISMLVSYSNQPNGRIVIVQGTLDNRGSGGNPVDGLDSNVLLQGELPFEQTFVLQIERVARTQARFSIFERDDDGPTLLAFSTRDFSVSPGGTLPDELFISVGTGGTRATFDNVTVNQP